MISTENILFILGGSFERNTDNLEAVIKKRIKHNGNLRDDGSVVIRGFDPNERGPEDDKYRNYLPEATADDYIRFGLLPELVGRAPVRSFANLLSKNDLIRIMKDAEDSIRDQYKVEFSLFGIELKITDDADDYVVGIAIGFKKKILARIELGIRVRRTGQYVVEGSDR
jgi:ATP-dependent Clp protease ATP-binding subunit ClpX